MSARARWMAVLLGVSTGLPCAGAQHAWGSTLGASFLMATGAAWWTPGALWAPVEAPTTAHTLEECPDGRHGPDAGPCSQGGGSELHVSGPAGATDVDPAVLFALAPNPRCTLLWLLTPFLCPCRLSQLYPLLMFFVWVRVFRSITCCASN